MNSVMRRGAPAEPTSVRAGQRRDHQTLPVDMEGIGERLAAASGSSEATNRETSSLAAGPDSLAPLGRAIASRAAVGRPAAVFSPG